MSLLYSIHNRAKSHPCILVLHQIHVVPSFPIRSSFVLSGILLSDTFAYHIQYVLSAIRFYSYGSVNVVSIVSWDATD